MTLRFVVELSIFPRNPWIVRDLVTGTAEPRNSKGHFSHWATEEKAQKAADKLNAKHPLTEA